MTSSRDRPQAPGTRLAALVDDAAAQVARRVRRRGVAWWRTATPAGRTRAAAVGALVASLARYEQAIETGAGPEPATYRTPPRPPREDVLVDQLAVVAYDLGRALREAADVTAPARLPGELVVVAQVAARAAAEALLAAYEVDPQPLPAPLLDALSATDVGPFRDALERLPRQRDG